MFANCAFFHPADVTFMRDDYTNTPFHHLPILPPTYQPPLMLTMIQILLDLQNKFTAMESNNLKDTGGVQSHPVACQQTSDLLSKEEGPPLPAVNIQKEDNSINSSASVSSERISKLEDPVKEKKKSSWWPSWSGNTEVDPNTGSPITNMLIPSTPMKDTSTQTAGENSTIMDINNLKTKVDNLEKIVRHQSDSADSNLVETLENRIKQDLMQEMMGRLKTDITVKVDKITNSNAILNTIFTNLQQNMEGLAGKVENKIQTMDGIGTEFNSLIEKVKYLETDNIKAKVDNIITNNAILNKNITFIKTEVEKHINRLQTDITTLQNNMKGLAGKVENKKGLAGNVEKKIQTMDGLGTELNSLGEKVTDMEISIKNVGSGQPKNDNQNCVPKVLNQAKIHEEIENQLY